MYGTNSSTKQLSVCIKSNKIVLTVVADIYLQFYFHFPLHSITVHTNKYMYITVSQFETFTKQ